MAYLAFDLDRAEAAPHVATAASFSPVEWVVVQLARRDGLASLRRPTRIGTMLRRLFGLGGPNRLADPRLEALRCAAVRCWHGERALDREMIDGLLGAGFRFDQISLLATHARA